MQAHELHLGNLLETTSESGIIRLMSQRVLLFDTLALGLLQKELIDSIGLKAARSVFSRFGYAHGWRTAESLKRDWSDLMHKDSATGPRLHTLHGQLTHLTLERSTDDAGNLMVTSTWKDSYEVEQYLLHYGHAEEPVCWTMAAFASGYVSNRTGQEIYFIEMDCVAKGDDTCRLIGRPRKCWEDHYHDQLNYFSSGAIDSLLPDLTQKLKKLEQQLTVKKRQIAVVENEMLYDELSARSESMRRTIDLAGRMASVDSSILISGESGVGKEKFARLIHDSSSRVGRPFIAINCGALTESLLESELFGYVKGAFTDAVCDRVGLFEAANGGTLFLDEVGDLPYPMQVKLLRVLEEREIRRIGDSLARPVNIRLLSATNKNLSKEVEHGRFRQDLYYRLRVIELKVPPVRERTDDIFALASHFAESMVSHSGREPVTFSPEAVQRMKSYSWPGNVRELRNAVEYALALSASNRIELADLPEELQQYSTGDTQDRFLSLASVEKEHILKVLATVQGNKAQAAQLLGIGNATLYRKLKRFSQGHVS